ncbi:MAG: hypothetical protein ACTSRP_27890, partial [Candidatus Helarchaeota archaeon]
LKKIGMNRMRIPAQFLVNDLNLNKLYSIDLDLFAYENYGVYLFGQGYGFLGIGLSIALISLFEDWKLDVVSLGTIDILFGFGLPKSIPLLRFYDNLDPTSIILELSIVLLGIPQFFIVKLNNQGPSSKSLIKFEKIGFILGFEYIIAGLIFLFLSESYLGDVV